MKRPRKRPRGFYARQARARGVSLQVVYLELNPDKWPCVRAQHESDATSPWSREELERMNRAFCEAVLREIARGTERSRGAAAPSPRRADKSAAAAGERERRG